MNIKAKVAKLENLMCSWSELGPALPHLVYIIAILELIGNWNNISASSRGAFDPKNFSLGVNSLIVEKSNSSIAQHFNIHNRRGGHTQNVAEQNNWLTQKGGTQPQCHQTDEWTNVAQWTDVHTQDAVYVYISKYSTDWIDLLLHN